MSSYINAALRRLVAERAARLCEYCLLDEEDRMMMNWHEHIVVDPNILVGKPVVRGTRIAVEFVMDMLGRGWTAQQILAEYDHLDAADIQACQAYAAEMLKAERVYVIPG